MSQINTLGPVGFNPMGEYNNTTKYERLDVVYYNCAVYVALKDSIGQTPTNTEYWIKLLDIEELDVQDEIDHKLDEMVEDGTLLNIIKNFLPIKIFPNICGATYISGTWETEKEAYQSFYNLGGRKAQIVQNVTLNIGNQTCTPGNLQKLQTAIDELKEMGYESIMVKIHISTTNGSLSTQTNEQLIELLNVYSLVLLDYAEICEDKNVDIFVISNEMPYFTTNNSLLNTWISIYNNIREVYNGLISHSMTIDESKNFTLYEIEDIICFNLYPSLSYNPDATIYDCFYSRDLDNRFIQIQNIKNKYNKKIYITETGCEHQKGRLGQPGYYSNNTNLSYSTQYIYFKTLFDYIKHNAMYIEDIYIWEICYSFTFLDNELVTNLIKNIINGDEYYE